jgi:transcriptional antiterminator RfaH
VKSWYLLHTKSRQEYLAKQHLERQGFESYLPLAPALRRRRGRAVRVIEPMFPRYLFIHLSDQTDNWHPIHSTIGVNGLVRFGQIPARIPDALIASLQDREDKDGVQILVPRDYKSGERVRIMEGPLEGFEGIFQCHSGRERVVLLLETTQKLLKVILDSSRIESA